MADHKNTFLESYTIQIKLVLKKRTWKIYLIACANVKSDDNSRKQKRRKERKEKKKKVALMKMREEGRKMVCRAKKISLSSRK